jgi:hypothetical protein
MMRRSAGAAALALAALSIFLNMLTSRRDPDGSALESGRYAVGILFVLTLALYLVLAVRGRTSRDAERKK